MRNFFRTVGVLWFIGVMGFGVWGTYAYYNPEVTTDPSEAAIATVFGLASVDADAGLGEQLDQFQQGRERGKGLLAEVQRSHAEAQEMVAQEAARKKFGDDWGSGAIAPNKFSDQSSPNQSSSSSRSEYESADDDWGQ